MNDLILVQVVQATKDLPNNVLHYVLAIRIIVSVDDVEERAVHDLEEDPDAIFVVEGVVDLEDGFVGATLVHETDFVDDKVAVFLILWAAELHRAHFFVLFALDLENFSEATLTELILVA